MFGELSKFPEHGTRNETIFRVKKSALPFDTASYYLSNTPVHIVFYPTEEQFRVKDIFFDTHSPIFVR